MNISELEFTERLEAPPRDCTKGDLIIAAYPTESIRFAIYQPGICRLDDGFSGGVRFYSLLTMTRTWIVKGDIRKRPSMGVEEAAINIIKAGEELTNPKATVSQMLVGLPPVVDSGGMEVAA